MRTLVPAAVLAALFLAGSAAAQAPQAPQDPGPYVPGTAGPYEPVRRDALGTRLINSATPFTIGRRRLEVHFTHRFRQPVNDSTWHELWGLDSGADTGIGLAYGLTSHFDLSLYRAGFQENYEVAAKFLFFEQAARVPLTVAVRAGADLPQRTGVEDTTRPFAQLLVSKRIAHGVNFLVSPSWVGDTPRLKDAFNIPLGLTFPLPGGRLVELEYVPKNRDLDDSRQAWHVAISKALGGHIFEILVGNSRATTVDQILGGDSAAGFETDDVRLGFNIVRYFGP